MPDMVTLALLASATFTVELAKGTHLEVDIVYRNSMTLLWVAI